MSGVGLDGAAPVHREGGKGPRRPKNSHIINEDDHFDCDELDSNFTAVLKEHVFWGFFDCRMK